MIYIAGPILGAPLEQRYAEFADAEAQLNAVGHLTFNPTKYPPMCGGSCQGARERDGDEHARECYLKWDIVYMLQHCHSVALLPGWEWSAGASEEQRIAKHCGLKVQLLAYWLNSADVRPV